MSGILLAVGFYVTAMTECWQIRRCLLVVLFAPVDN
jgi:hypothetical protein